MAYRSVGESNLHRYGRPTPRIQDLPSLDGADSGGHRRFSQRLNTLLNTIIAFGFELQQWEAGIATRDQCGLYGIMARARTRMGLRNFEATAGRRSILGYCFRHWSTGTVSASPSGVDGVEQVYESDLCYRLGARSNCPLP